MTTEELLGRVPVFSDLSPAQLARLSQLVAPRTFAEGAVIIREGETDAALYMIVQGQVAVTKRTPTGAAFELARLAAPEIVGDMALLDGQSRSATVTALEPTECLVLDRPAFLATLHAEPALAIAMLPTLSQRIRLLEQRLLALSATEVHRSSLA
ncbi:MAG TPA: cyclic nucleotide-binding domain-containing protein [Chloroflexia bacterium]|nr:cyclic nucleotide-binding domain-containing protein [Chloroflexia bacterium]